MPNGFDKNFRRLLRACAYYRQRHGEWPSQARMHASILRDIAHLLRHDDFVKLSVHLQLRTRDTPSISVGGSKGYLDYQHVTGELDAQSFELAQKWLDIEAHHYPGGLDD